MILNKRKSVSTIVYGSGNLRESKVSKCKPAALFVIIFSTPHQYEIRKIGFFQKAKVAVVRQYRVKIAEYKQNRRTFFKNVKVNITTITVRP